MADHDTEEAYVLSDDDDIEDIFANNMQRFAAVKQRAEELLPPAVPVLCGISCDADDGLSEDDSDADSDAPLCRNSPTLPSSQSVLDDLDPDNLSPLCSPVSKRTCTDLDNVRWALEPTIEQDIDELAPTSDTSVKSDSSRRINVLVLVGAKTLRIPCSRGEKFRTVFEQVSSSTGVPLERVFLALGDKTISTDQTPLDVGLRLLDVLDFWEGSAASAAASTAATGSGSSAVVEDPNSVTLKLQSVNRRCTVHITLARDEPMTTLMAEYARQRDTAVDKLRFFFDGDALQPDDTAVTLDLEGGECIDVHDRIGGPS